MILALCTTLGEHLVHKFIPPKLDDIKIIFKLYMSMFFYVLFHSLILLQSVFLCLTIC